MYKVSDELICSSALGSVYNEIKENGVTFHRFTKAQEKAYAEVKPEYNKKVTACAGVVLSFATDSENLGISFSAFGESTRRYLCAEVFSNGKKVGDIRNFGEIDFTNDYMNYDYPLGSFSGNFKLGKGEKQVKIYLPWNYGVLLESLTLSDGATFTPVRPGKKIITYGDSITQGYDALFQFSRYGRFISEYFGAEEVCKAIGGEIFCPHLSKEKDGFEPYFITVAYGTNDWSNCKKEEFEQNCEEFFANLIENYPNVPVFVISPIVRAEMKENTLCGDFLSVRDKIFEVADKYPNTVKVNGTEFFGMEEKYFGDRTLHPNDSGFSLYAEALKNAIEKSL